MVEVVVSLSESDKSSDNMVTRTHYYAQSHTTLYPFSANQSAPAWKRAQMLRDGTLVGKP